MTQTPRRTQYPEVITQADVAEFLAIGYRGVKGLPIEWVLIQGKARWLKEDVLGVRQTRARQTLTG